MINSLSVEMIIVITEVEGQNFFRFYRIYIRSSLTENRKCSERGKLLGRAKKTPKTDTLVSRDTGQM